MKVLFLNIFNFDILGLISGIAFIFFLASTWVPIVNGSDYPQQSDINNLQTLKQDIDGEIALTGTDQWDKGADVVSASPLLVLGDGNYFVVTGNNAITSIQASQSQPGTAIYLKFSGTPLITHHATNLILPGGANITAAAGDIAIFVHDDTGNKWRCVVWTKADGTVVVGGAVSPRTSETKTANYLVTVNDGAKSIEMDNAAERTFTLPAASSAGKGFWIRLIKEGAGKVIIQTDGTDTIADSGAGGTLYNDIAGQAGWASVVIEVDYDEGGFSIVSISGLWVTT